MPLQITLNFPYPDVAQSDLMDRSRARTLLPLPDLPREADAPLNEYRIASEFTASRRSVPPSHLLTWLKATTKALSTAD
jgi:hypothetical protein